MHASEIYCRSSWPRTMSIQICLSSLISKWHNPFVDLWYLRPGRIKLHENDLPLISWKSFDIPNLDCAWVKSAWVDSLLASEWGKERVKENFQKWPLEKNIGIRRVCVDSDFFILWYALCMIYCHFWKILFPRVDEQLVTSFIFFQITILTVWFSFLISNFNRCPGNI